MSKSNLKRTTMEILLSAAAIAAILIAFTYRSRCAAVIAARNNTELLLGESQRQRAIMLSDIRLLVSDNPADAAKAKQTTDRWRAEFGLTKNEEFKCESPLVSGCALPPLNLITAEGLALDTITGQEVSSVIDNTQIALLFMHGYSHAKGLLNKR